MLVKYSFFLSLVISALISCPAPSFAGTPFEEPEVVGTRIPLQQGALPEDLKLAEQLLGQDEGINDQQGVILCCVGNGVLCYARPDKCAECKLTCSKKDTQE